MVYSPQGTTKRPRKDGGIRCAAWGCDKSKLKDNIGVFEFPDRERSPDRFRFWCSLVGRTRKDFRFSKGTSRLCADHFDSDQIENWMRIKLMKEKDPVAARKIHWRLIPHARPNPSLFPRPVHGSTPQPKQPLSIGNSVEPTRRRAWPRQTTSEDMAITRRPRNGAAAIRGRKRLVEDAQTDMAQNDLEMMAQQDAISDMMDIDVREVAEGHGLETGKSRVTHRDIHIQVNRRPTHRSTRVQVCPKTFSLEAGPSGEQSSSLISIDAIIREYDENEANGDTVCTPESVQGRDSSGSEWERSDSDTESEKKNDCGVAALVLSPVNTHKRRFRVKQVPLDHYAVPCGSSRCHVLQSDSSNNRQKDRDGKGELKIKDEPVDGCVIVDGNISLEDSHHSLQSWENSSDQDEFEVKEEPVDDDYACAFDSNGLEINEEEISGSPQKTSVFLIQLKHSVQEGNYTPDQVFIVSKTGLFWKRLPGQTCISKKEELSSGYKARNDRLSLLLCANASGDLRLKPFLVYHTCKLKDLKVSSFQMLPVHWRYNRRASLTAVLFEDWFANCAVPEILAYCKQKNIEEKALILVDSVIGQSDMVNEIHPHIKVIFMSSDISPSIEPPDHFAITQFLQLYTKTLLQNMLIFTEGGDESQVEDFLKSYSIKEALFTIRDSWTAIKNPFLSKFWSNVWRDETQNFTRHPNASREIQEIQDLANRIPGQGFTDITVDDIHKHLESLQEELSTEELAQMIKATEGDDDDQQDTPKCSVPPTEELESIVKLLYKTERKIIETEWNPKRLEQSLPHLSSIRAMYIDILKTRKKR